LIDFLIAFQTVCQMHGAGVLIGGMVDSIHCLTTKILKEFAAMLAASVRPYDLVYTSPQILS
jgi:hypothetical protein